MNSSTANKRRVSNDVCVGHPTGARVLHLAMRNEATGGRSSVSDVCRSGILHLTMRRVMSVSSPAVKSVRTTPKRLDAKRLLLSGAILATAAFGMKTTRKRRYIIDPITGKNVLWEPIQARPEQLEKERAAAALQAAIAAEPSVVDDDYRDPETISHMYNRAEFQRQGLGEEMCRRLQNILKQNTKNWDEFIKKGYTVPINKELDDLKVADVLLKEENIDILERLQEIVMNKFGRKVGFHYLGENGQKSYDFSGMIHVNYVGKFYGTNVKDEEGIYKQGAMALHRDGFKSSEPDSLMIAIALATDYEGGELVCKLNNGDIKTISYDHVGDVGMFTGDVVHAVKRLENGFRHRELLILRVQFSPFGFKIDRVMREYGRHYPADHHGIKFFRQALQKSVEEKWGGENTDTKYWDHPVDSRSNLGKSQRALQRLMKIDPMVAKAVEDRLKEEEERLRKMAIAKSKARMMGLSLPGRRRRKSAKKSAPAKRWGTPREVEAAAQDYENLNGRLPTRDELKEHIATASESGIPTYDFRAKYSDLKNAVKSRRRLFASKSNGLDRRRLARLQRLRFSEEAGMAL